MTATGLARTIPVAVIVFSFFLPLSAGAATKELLQAAKTSNALTYDYAVSQKPDIKPTEGSLSYSLFWAPFNYRPVQGVLVVLPSQDRTVFDEFFEWKAPLENQGMAFLGVQWNAGLAGAEKELSIEEIHSEIDRVLRRKKIRSRKAILYGYAEGALRTYALIALDQAGGTNWFRGAIANAGAADTGFFRNREVEIGMFGPKPFTKVSWALCCGAKDERPSEKGCDGMRKTKPWIEKFGGKVVFFVRDMTSAQEGFYKSRKRMENALDALRL